LTVVASTVVAVTNSAAVDKPTTAMTAANFLITLITMKPPIAKTNR
jgi:hypothetical protein